jgi:hypothetical protein
VSAEGFTISNPRGNNRNLEISFPKAGTWKKIKTLRPGEAFRCEKREVRVIEVGRPLRLQLLENGEFVDDRRI